VHGANVLKHCLFWLYCGELKKRKPETDVVVAVVGRVVVAVRRTAVGRGVVPTATANDTFRAPFCLYPRYSFASVLPAFRHVSHGFSHRLVIFLSYPFMTLVSIKFLQYPIFLKIFTKVVTFLIVQRN